jgi:hypothetical protein
LLSEAERLAQQASEAALAPKVPRAKATLDELKRNLKAYLGDIRAQQEKYLADISHWSMQLEAALNEQPPSLANLQKFAQEGESLRQQSPRSLDEDVKQARANLERRLAGLQQTVSNLQKDLEQWISKAEAIINSSRILWESSEEDTAPMKKAINDLQHLLELTEKPSFPRHDSIGQRTRRIRELITELQTEVGRYEIFDRDLKELRNTLEGKPDDERRSRLSIFLATHSVGDHPRRKRQLAELGKEVERLGGSIDATRKEGVVRKLQELRDHADRLEAGRSIAEVRRAYDDFLKAAQDYLRASDPQPQQPEEVERLKKEAVVVLDAAEWKDVQLFARRNDSDFEAIARRAKEYLDGTLRIETKDQRYKVDAEKLVRKAIADHWKNKYREFYERATGIKEVRDVEDASMKGRKFLELVEVHPSGWQGGFAPSEDKWHRRTRQVHNWNKWAEGLSSVTGRQAYLMVDPTPVTKDRRIWVQAWLETRSSESAQPQTKPVPVVWKDDPFEDGRTDWFIGRGEMLLELPPCDLKGGTALLQFAITIDNWFTYGDTKATVEVRLPKDFFSYQTRRREFEFPSWEGKKAILEVSSGDLEPPILDKPD